MKKTFDSVLGTIEARASRDPQQKRVYDAEDMAQNMIGGLRLNPVTCIMLTDDIQKSAELRALYPIAMEERFRIVLKGKTKTSAYAFMGTIFLPHWAHLDWIVCHEIAHIVEAREFGEVEEGHGPRFCGIMIDIVRCVISPKAADTLKKCYKGNNVEYFSHE